MKIRSIKHLLLFIFVSILLVMLISIIALSWLNMRFYADMDKLVADSGQFINFSAQLKDMSDKFEQFDRSIDMAEEYRASILAADMAMESLRLIVLADGHVAMFYRSLLIMRDYEAELREKLFETDVRSSEYFNLRNRLIRAYGLIIQQSYNMQQQYLQYLDRRYVELANEYRVWQMGTYIAVLSISCVIIIYIVFKLRKVVAEMRRYAARARDMEAGRLDIPDLNPCGLTELDAFATAFNSMKSTIRQNIEQLRDKADMETQLKLLKQSQLRSLQNNMNPHFLFNTLNIISRLAMFEGSQRIVDLMESAAKILRYNMSNLERLVPLTEELSIAYAYIEIQQTRFGEWISFDINVENFALLDEYRIPPMILQPIIENCIVHGFKNKSKNCEIYLHVTEDDGNAVLAVEDNGCGMSDLEIAAIFDKENSTGLRNIKERLDLIFAHEGFMQLKSKETAGLIVTLRLPLLSA